LSWDALITPYYIPESDKNFLTTLECLKDLHFVYMYMWYSSYICTDHDHDIGHHYQKDFGIDVPISGIPGYGKKHNS